MFHLAAQNWLGQLDRGILRLRRALIRARKAEPLEYEQLIIRYGIGIFITLTAIISAQFEMLSPLRIKVLTIYLSVAWILGFAFFVHFLFWLNRRLERRTATIIYDAAALSVFIYLAGKSASIFFPVYLWVILGNGFRFGISYMYASMVANAGLFALTAFLTPHWRDQWQFSLGALLALVAIPIYVAKLIHELREAMARAEEANKAKSEFLSTMSHELRTPLNAIMGLSQILDQTAASPEDRMSAMSIHSAASRLLEMVDSILNFQKVRNRAVEVHERSFDLKQLLVETRSIMLPLASRKKLRIHFRFASAVPDRLISDYDHLKTIILNLVTNSVKYTKEGDIWITASFRDRENGAGTMRIEVRDTGIGIDPAYNDTLFERFVQTKETERSAEGGVGLGLSMSKSLVMLLGGKIDFTSKVGEGSTFWFEVPVAVDVEGGQTAEDATCKRIAFLTSRSDHALIMKDASPKQAECGALVSNARDFVKAQAASGDLWKFVLIVDEKELDEWAIKAIKNCAASAPVPPAIVLLNTDSESGHSLTHIATSEITELEPATARSLIQTVAKWHGVALEYLKVKQEETPAPARAARVLVADDNPFNRQVAKKLLALDGHKVTLATTGEEALDALLKGGFDIAFLDINMPEGDGIEVSKQYNMMVDPSAQIPLIAMTADVSPQTRANCLKAGMSAVLHKPVQLRELRQNLKAHTKLDELAEPAEESREPNTQRTAGRRAKKAATLDRERVIELIRLFGLGAFRDQMLSLFKSEFQLGLEAFRNAIEEKDGRAIRDTMHALKSASNNIGATRIAELCSEMRQTPENVTEKTFNAIRREYGKFVREMDALLASQDVPAASSPPSSRGRPVGGGAVVALEEETPTHQWPDTNGNPRLRRIH